MCRAGAASAAQHQQQQRRSGRTGRYRSDGTPGRTAPATSSSRGCAASMRTHTIAQRRPLCPLSERRSNDDERGKGNGKSLGFHQETRSRGR